MKAKDIHQLYMRLLDGMDAPGRVHRRVAQIVSQVERVLQDADKKESEQESDSND